MITTDKRVLNRRENTNFRNKDKTILQMYEHYLTEIQEHPIRLKYTSILKRRNICASKNDNSWGTKVVENILLLIKNNHDNNTDKSYQRVTD